MTPINYGVLNKKDLWFFEAPMPSLFHRCKPWSTAKFYTNEHGPEHIERCACGAIRVNYGQWFNKNERRHNRKRSRKVVGNQP